MKLLTYQHNGKEVVGVLTVTGNVILPVTALGLKYDSMNELIQCATSSELAKLRAAASAPAIDGIPYDAAGKVAPIPEPQQDVICLGYNYLDHVDESGAIQGAALSAAPAYPIYFSKRVNRAVPDGGQIQSHPALDKQLDYEVELAVIIGRDAKNVSIEQTADYIFGYTILNDISARTLQTRHKQFYFGKSLDGATPMGPWIVTADEFDFPPKLTLQSLVNGELRQDSDTGHMLFSIAHVIAELSAGMTLKAGTIIATGTPAGVGVALNPPQLLKAGDVVECVIEGIGRLCNTVG